MKIITWNANSKFREKYKEIQKQNADIYIIQECENPKNRTEEGYLKFSENSYWTGNLHYKGLGIFAKPKIILEPIQVNDTNPQFFIPLRVNDSFNLLGMWTQKPYVEELHRYFNNNPELFNEDLIIAGDMNSNKIWDKERRKDKNHSAMIEKLEKVGLYSQYHQLKNEKQGEETWNTFYLTRNPNKHYYIDYIFCKNEKIKSLEILDMNHWLKFSGHTPILFDI